MDFFILKPTTLKNRLTYIYIYYFTIGPLMHLNIGVRLQGAKSGNFQGLEENIQVFI